MSRRQEKFWMWLAWRLPRPLAYWATIRVGAHGTTGQYGDTDAAAVPFMEVLKRWEPTI